MKYSYLIEPYTLHFREPAGTSRGVYRERRIWLVRLKDAETGREGIGECAPLPHLSCDDLPDYEVVLHDACESLSASGKLNMATLRRYPSILFGLETALQHVSRGTLRLFDTQFARGEVGIPINGLIWMGSFEEMNRRIEAKLSEGFRCIKLKIGAIVWDEELSLLKKIRQRYDRNTVELRVDANGAFSPDDALQRLNDLARLDIHSIEQPIRAGQWSEMGSLCKKSPLPIALDEELIGVNNSDERQRLLDEIRPQYIVVKPSLHGGMEGTREWIKLAEQRNVGSWITSALESNIGLNAIAHLTASVYGSDITMPQGLGTGALYTNNVKLGEYSLAIDNCRLTII